MLEEKIGAFSHLLTPITTAISIVSVIVYITFYAGSLDKRIAILEDQQRQSSEQMEVLRDNLNAINNTQDNEQSQFHDDVKMQLAQMGDRIEKIYSIILDARKHETI